MRERRTILPFGEALSFSWVFGDAGVTMTGGVDISIDACGPTDRIFAKGFDRPRCRKRVSASRQ
jgi:hypothetical protein